MANIIIFFIAIKFVAKIMLFDGLMKQIPWSFFSVSLLIFFHQQKKAVNQPQKNTSSVFQRPTNKESKWSKLNCNINWLSVISYQSVNCTNVQVSKCQRVRITHNPKFKM